MGYQIPGWICLKNVKTWIVDSTCKVDCIFSILANHMSTRDDPRIMHVSGSCSVLLDYGIMLLRKINLMLFGCICSKSSLGGLLTMA